MGKYSLIVVAGFVMTFGIIRANLNQMSGHFSDRFVEHYERAEARMTATAAAHMALATLSDSASWRAGYSNVSIGGGTGWTTLVDNATDTSLSTSQVRITAGGSSGSSVDTVVVLVSLSSAIPPGVHGGVTASSRVTVKDSMIVDGRDHDLNGALISGQGIKGISTTQDFEQADWGKIGGTTSGGVDYTPSNPANSAVVEQSASYTPSSTPDGVFGVAEGTLKTKAQSGANGSQYVTDPSDLNFPLSGVTYVERPGSDGWENIDFGSSSGVLVVHNSTTESWMKNINTGTFTGLIIADDINLIHVTIIGSVVSLTTNPQGYTVGDGAGEILFSSEALQQAGALAGGSGGGGGGGGGGGVTVSSWLE